MSHRVEKLLFRITLDSDSPNLVFKDEEDIKKLLFDSGFKDVSLVKKLSFSESINILTFICNGNSEDNSK